MANSLKNVYHSSAIVTLRMRFRIIARVYYNYAIFLTHLQKNGVQIAHHNQEMDTFLLKVRLLP